ncbi:MAG: DMT family transporter, partial [Pseudomonadota bacterium]
QGVAEQNGCGKKQDDALPPLRASEAAALAYLGLGAAALAFWLWQQGISALGPARAGPFMNIVPISSLALGWLLLGTPVNGLEIAAFAVVLLGVALSNAPRAWIAPVLSPRVALCLAIVLMPSQAVA